VSDGSPDYHAASARAALIRGAAIYTPLFVAGVIMTVLSVLRVLDAGRVLTVLEALVTLLFGHQSIQSIRDLNATVVRTEGRIGRRWTKMDFLVSRSHYISVGRAIFRIPVVDWHLFEEDEAVAVIHYPHTGTVVAVERLPASADSRGGNEAP
jgi:hypothetical protein